MACDFEGLRHRIMQAFADVHYPGDDNLLQSQSWYQGHYDREAMDDLEYFGGKHWSELEQLELCEPAAGLIPLSTAAKLFFLPGVMLYDIRTGDVMAECFFTNPEYYSKFKDDLTLAQCEAVEEYLRMIIDREPTLYSRPGEEFDIDKDPYVWAAIEQTWVPHIRALRAAQNVETPAGDRHPERLERPS